VLRKIPKPISFNRLLAEELKTPRVSNAISSIIIIGIDKFIVPSLP